MQDSLQPSTVINDQLESLVDRPQSYKGSDAPAHNHQPMHIALLTGANDPTYAQDLALSLAARGVDVDFIGSDDVRAPLDARIHFLNLRGGQSRNAGALAKVVRILRYYGRLMCYAWTARPLAFHILWNNKFEMLDRTLLMAWYRMAGRRIFFTAHNVNVGKRDDQDSRMNRLTLRIQYRLATHIFVHTNKMKRELQVEFDVPVSKVSVIPFATPDVTPSTNLSPLQARQRLGLAAEDKVLLFFGQIAPYKGLEYLLQALKTLTNSDATYRLIIAGKVKQGHESYWKKLESDFLQPVQKFVVAHIKHIDEDKIESYFQASDVLVLPYVDIYQSGVLFMAYRFGLPVVATDVGSLRDSVLEGKTGHVCAAKDPEALSRAISDHFGGLLYERAADTRSAIKEYARIHHSWSEVAATTELAYRRAVSPRSVPKA